MIVLHTDVVSEAMKPEPNPAVLAWLNGQAAETLYITSVTLAELLFGIQALPQGRRRDLLDGALNALLDLFRDRVLPFDTEAARCYAELAVAATNGGVASRRRMAKSPPSPHREASSWRHAIPHPSRRLGWRSSIRGTDRKPKCLQR